MKIINSCSPGDKKSNFPFKVWSFKILNEAFLHRSELNIFFCDVPSDVTSVGRLSARQPRWTQFESRASTCFESEDGKFTLCSLEVVVFVPNRFLPILNRFWWHLNWTRRHKRVVWQDYFWRVAIRRLVSLPKFSRLLGKLVCIFSSLYLVATTLSALPS